MASKLWRLGAYASDSRTFCSRLLMYQEMALVRVEQCTSLTQVELGAESFLYPLGNHR